MADGDMELDEEQLDALDVRADAVEFDESESSFHASTSESESFSSENDADLARYANTGPQKRIKTSLTPGYSAHDDRSTNDRSLNDRSSNERITQDRIVHDRAVKNSINDEEDDVKLKTASWRDMEDARRFLTEDHLERLDNLIDKWENTNQEEGDDIDLNTGLVVLNKGHLNAMSSQRQNDLLWLGDEDSSEDSEDQIEEEDTVQAKASSAQLDGAELDDGSDFGTNPLFTVCQTRAILLNKIMEKVRGRWYL